MQAAKKVISFVALTFLILLHQANGQSSKKYPSVFWEISGNGLKKPSYLFGTMHVSSKMAFHLSDSFYLAMKNVDAVALELNPDLWQSQMVEMEKIKNTYAAFTNANQTFLLNENSFQMKDYIDELKLALSSEPAVMNNLLYRTYKVVEDFEEDTFLDLYIFQTGKKMGKRSAGVEDLFETEKIVIEAYTDMAIEKKKKEIDTDGESMRDISKKMQDAYRRGDLDLMDSLDILMERSMAFREKFLYKRNEIQAGSIDSILKKSSLFVGVGAAHLPGPRGVIEMLRKKGYRLRPIKMGDRDAAKKEATDQLKVPVTFQTTIAEDSSYTVATPGPLFELKEDYQQLNRRQFADMNNGSFYLVTRIQTHASFLGEKVETVLKRTDSLLYEHIPGKIITKKSIEKDGLKGFDIVNKTRRGDIQHYQIYVTPEEIFIFKMSGKENYVQGAEAQQFFGSIKFNPRNASVINFSPAQGGFTVSLPQKPSFLQRNGNSDGLDRWDYSTSDPTTGDAYLIMKKSVQYFRYLEEDTFNLQMIEESFHSGDLFERQLSRKVNQYDGRYCIDVQEKMKDSSFVTARMFLSGPHHYVVAARSKSPNKDFSAYLNSFHIKPYLYDGNKNYVDSFMQFSVNSPVILEMDTAFRSAIEKAAKLVMEGKKSTSSNFEFWPSPQQALFRSNITGECIAMSIQPYPKYYFIKDTATFWNGEIKDRFDTLDLTLASKAYFENNNGVKGYQFSLTDTGSSRKINRVVLVKGNRLYSLVYISDTSIAPNSFFTSFLQSFSPLEKNMGPSLFNNQLDTFFIDLFSKDSTTRTRARLSISNIYFGPKGVDGLLKAIAAIPNTDKDYFDVKTKLVNELGYIKGGDDVKIAQALKKIYDQSVDTPLVQNQAILALSRNKSQPAYTILKEIILQDPPVFEDEDGYETLFRNISDSLKLAATLFPEILQLATIDDYKESVNDLLEQLVDSGLIKKQGYKDYFSKIFFNAKIAIRKQMTSDTKETEEEKKEEEEAEEDNENDTYEMGYNRELVDFAILLMPYYDEQPAVQKWFDKLLTLKGDYIRLATIELLLKNKRTVPQSAIDALAANKHTVTLLYEKLEGIQQLDRFPKAYKNQALMAKYYLMADKDLKKMDSVVFIGTHPASLEGITGQVYFFKYRIRKEDDWKIGISGIQPLDTNKIGTENKLTSMTDKKLKEDQPVMKQFLDQLKKIHFNFHKTGVNFYDNNGYRY